MHIYKIFFLFNSIILFSGLMSMDSAPFFHNIPLDIYVSTHPFYGMRTVIPLSSTSKDLRRYFFGIGSPTNSFENRFFTFIFQCPTPRILQSLSNKRYCEMLEKSKNQLPELQKKIDELHEKTLKMREVFSKFDHCTQFKACDYLPDEEAHLEKMKNESLAIKELLEHGACYNYNDSKDGYTPIFHKICSSGNYFVAELLLQYGIDVNVVNKLGETVLFDVVNLLAISFNHDLIPDDKLPVLSTPDIGQDWASLRKKERDLIHQKNDEINMKMVELLVQYGIDINKEDRPCRCKSMVRCECIRLAIDNAFFENNYKVVNFLRAHGARTCSKKAEYMVRRNIMIIKAIGVSLFCGIMYKLGSWMTSLMR